MPRRQASQAMPRPVAPPPMTRSWVERVVTDQVPVVGGQWSVAGGQAGTWQSATRGQRDTLLYPPATVHCPLVSRRLRRPVGLPHAREVADELERRRRLLVAERGEEGVGFCPDNVGMKQQARPPRLEGPGLRGGDQMADRKS